MSAVTVTVTVSGRTESETPSFTVSENVSLVSRRNPRGATKVGLRALPELSVTPSGGVHA